MLSVVTAPDTVGRPCMACRLAQGKACLVGHLVHLCAYELLPLAVIGSILITCVRSCA